MNISKQSAIRYFAEFKDKYWNDPVWSKVISAAIITILGTVITTFWLLVKSFIKQISFQQAFIQLLTFLREETPINNFVVAISILFFLSVTGWFCLKLSRNLIIKRGNLNQKREKSLPTVPFESTVLFAYRLAKAFPGQRNLQWYNDPKIAVQRLSLLLHEPLIFESGPSGYSPTPLWWFRGFSASNIDSFKLLSKTKVLMDRQELEIKRIAVHIDQAYYKCFVYVETKGEKQTGLYNFEADDINRQIETFGYSWEYFGLLNKRVIRSEELDDGATVINSKIVDASKAKPRTRYLTDYNFIITSHNSPYNSKKFEVASEKYFNDILKNRESAENFFEFLYTFRKREE